ncbi:TPA: DNA transfer protein [Salmonella enterica]|nr:acyltransferase [Salmonella enterica subsp. diarizonae]ECQ1024661.1 acyltransferase [Salmonella enterica subsp. diarizonae]HEA0294291.1 DNA transfer protein [Salmonella enterica]HEA0349569.1 DNA transfer protein [Salmonella enterica]HEA0354564.1 DNA transfer protein [Salmonella enterica]
MATWQQGINSGGFLAGIGTQNENAPKASDINATLGLIRENNDLARSGANNVALTGLRGLAGVADIYNQEQQQKALNAFNQVHANAWAAGDNSGLIKFAQENPAFVAQAQQAFSGLNEQQRNDMGDLAMKANVALSQGPEAYSKFITDNKDRLNRVGANPDWMIQTGVQNPEQLSHMLTTMSLGALGPEKAFAVQDKIVGREIDRGRLAETIRSNKAGEALTAQGQYISASNAAADRAQRAQMHNDNVAMKLQELGMKQQESGKIDPKLVRDLNSDINGFSKNYSAMRGAAENLQALGKRNTPAAQLGMIFNYMKSLDPQSVVREGEQVQVKRTDGIFGTLGNYVSQLSNGKMLNNEQVQDLINTSKLMANTEGEKFNQQMDDYLSTYGDSLPSGLTKQLQSRKAKLYEDIQQPAQQQTQQATSGGQTFREGMTAKNPKTGQKIIYRNGQWQPM